MIAAGHVKSRICGDFAKKIICTMGNLLPIMPEMEAKFLSDTGREEAQRLRMIIE